MDIVLSGRYQLVSALGQGGMGEVWRGTDTMLNRPVAVKLIRLSATPAGSGYDEAVKRFRREAQAVAALNHPNIVTAYDFGIDADTPYLVMELIDGVSLSEELNGRDADQLGALPLDRVFGIAADVLAGLGAAHSAGVIHRDLKPANLMTVTATGRVKIVDFGIARGTDLSKLTQTGGFVGTVAYMAPELMTTRGKVTGKADLYSFGCVMYELLTGGPAFDAAEPAQFIAAHIHSAPIPLRELLPGAPQPLEALLLELLEKKPENRPADAEEVAERLAEFAPTPTRRKRRTATPATLVESGEFLQVAAERPAEAPAATRKLSPAEAAGDLAEVGAAAASVGIDRATEPPAAAVVAADAAPKAPAARAPVEPDSLDIAGTRAERVPIPSRRNEPSDEPVIPPSRGGLYTLIACIAIVVVGALVWLILDSGNTKSGSSGRPTTSAGASEHPSGTPASTGPSAATPLTVTTMAAQAGCHAPSQLSFNRSGTLLAGAGPTEAGATDTGAGCVWNAGSGVPAVRSTAYGTVFSVAFTSGSDTRLVLMSHASTPINVIETNDSGSLRDSLRSDQNWPANPEAVAYAPDGDHIAVSDRDSDQVQTFSIGGHTIEYQVPGITRGPNGGYGNLAYSPNGKLLVRGEPDGFTVFTPDQNNPRPWHVPSSSSGPMPAAFAGINHLVTCHGDELEFWDLNAAAPKATAKLSGGTCAALAVSPDGTRFAVTMTSGSNADVNVGKLPAGWR